MKLRQMSFAILGFFILVGVSIPVLALELEKEPLRNLILKDSQLNLSSSFGDVIIGDTELYFQDGNRAFDNLDRSRSYCKVIGFFAETPESTGIYDNDQTLDIWELEGNFYDDRSLASPEFITTIRTSAFGGTGKVECHNPSP